ncbi:hypothetical protein JYT76_03750 [Olleya sp. AH-315-F22]|nr:hypothetical protein [Olleya sp. AH-315-F22]
MEQNKTGKYLKYAIGEILLVMIGILLALQVNNWNEERKDRKVELKILQELYSVLNGGVIQGDLSFQKEQIKQNKKSKASGNLIIKYFNDNLPYHDSLKSHFAYAHKRSIAPIKIHAYQNAKEYGLNFITNDSLKEQLSWAYETNTIWLNELNTRNNLYENSTVLPIITELFDNIDIGEYDVVGLERRSMIPNDYESLKTNKTYINLLKTTIHKREEYLLFQERRYERMLKLASYLNDEIEQN